MLAVIVAGREVLYIFSTVLALLICPAFLLLDPVTTWNEAAGTGQGVLRLGCYMLAPHNFVLLCITNRFRAWQRTFVATVCIQVVADFASCLLLGSLILDKIREGDDVPSALLVGCVYTLSGCTASAHRARNSMLVLGVPLRSEHALGAVVRAVGGWRLQIREHSIWICPVLWPVRVLA